ncbi:cupin domain protein [Roseovarius sp. A-2]|uniref:cupin domain-containing protein n=1 Tax=Roseovarius sp. A-2 TaxID=1570360 RepID=UPI0009B54F24|nr:cupin domain-containing protein [Roseovarius sp. A-2]GAW36375.1 cupin domain protein [Roseovarius sp. A-2]
MVDTSETPQDWMTSGPGAQRRILYQDKASMIGERDGEGIPHSHPHVQTTYVSAGQLRLNVAGVTTVLNPGDAIIIPSIAEHSCVCLQEGRLLDSFAPRSDDFMTAQGLALN